MANYQAPTGSSSLDKATALFRSEWLTYYKLVENNYLFHDRAYGRLHRELRSLEAPFSFLDIACGDAAASVRALSGTSVEHYCGLDLSEPALALAQTHVARLPCRADLRLGDFVELLRGWQQPVDVAWIGLALHHLTTTDKLSALTDVRCALGRGGRLLLFENTTLEGEDRTGWLGRWDEQRPTWPALDADEWERIAAHVHAADFPEPPSRWLELGREAGFRQVEQLLVTPTKLFGMFAYRL